MNVPQATIDGRPIQDWAEGLCSHDPGVRKEAALTLTQPAVPPSQSAPVLLGSLTDADSEVRCIVRDFFLHLASEICGLRHQEGERKEELAKAKTVLEAQMLTVLEHEKKLAFRSKEVEEMNRELEGLTYLVSHDLRSPLRAIQGYAIALLEDYGQAPRDQIREDAKRISDWAKRMDNLITGLLILGRAVRASPEPTMIQLRELVDQIRSELATQEAGRNVVWDIGDLPEVLADAGLLRTVVGNLLSNALKFTMMRNEAIIGVRATKSSSGTVVCVRDNGVGFDGNHAERLFQPFIRLHDVNDYEGRGIGLAVVKRIIARHGGETWAEGEVGRGAAFYFSLPEKPQTY